MLLSLLHCDKNNDECTDINPPGINGWNIKELSVSSVPSNYCGDIIDVQFLNRDTGFAVRASWQSCEPFYKTYDGGETWETYTVPEGEYNVTCIHFTNAETGCIAFDTVRSGSPLTNFKPKIFFTKNGGKTWSQKQPNFKGIIEFIYFKDTYHGFAVLKSYSLSKFIIYTEDGGTTWTKFDPINLGNAAIRWCVNNGVFYLVDYQNKIWKTEAAGSSWQPIYQISSDPIWEISFINDKELYYTTEKGLFFYGENNIAEQLSENFTKIILFDKNHAGITIQKRKECNTINPTNPSFGAGKMCLMAKKSKQEDWIEGNNSRHLLNRKCKVINDRSAICFYENYCFLLEKIN